MLIKIDHECDDGLMLLLTFEYTPGYGPVMYLRNGDPGYPGQPDIVELVEVQFISGDCKPGREKWTTWPARWAKFMEDRYSEEVSDAAGDAR
jgi:hypothetical protein